MNLDTIVALSTALQTQAISIIRMSGDEALPIIFQLTHKDFSLADHRITYAYLYDPFNQQSIDEVLVLVMKGPKSYTREDVVEIQCHGGVYISQKILSLILGLGARLAEPGEFTQRALINGRIDLVQAEAINELILANSEQAATLAISSLRGELSQLVHTLSDELLSILAHIEVNIDYPEYDIEQVTRQTLTPLCLNFKTKLQKVVEEAKIGQQMKQGIQTAIIGRPNVGKSSLLNALINEDKAIVTDIPGTTRDIVEGSIHLKNVTLHLMDTAGIRLSTNQIEQIGIDKTHQLIQKADLILFVLDASKPMDQEEKELYSTLDKDKVLLVYNKNDLVSIQKDISVSAKNKDINALIEAINQRYQSGQIIYTQPVLSTARTVGLAIQAYQSINSALSALELEMEIDLISIDLKACLTSILSITQGTETIDISHEIFSRFCVGK